MVNKFTIKEGKHLKTFCIQGWCKFVHVFVVSICAHCYLLSGISMLVHDLPFQIFNQLAKSLYFQLLLCLLIRVLEVFAKSFYFLGFLSIGHDC